MRCAFMLLYVSKKMINNFWVVETIIMANSIVQVDFHQTKVGLLPNANAGS